jgi:hypothetical protein
VHFSRYLKEHQREKTIFDAIAGIRDGIAQSVHEQRPGKESTPEKCHSK